VVETLSHILRQEPQHKVAVLLQQLVFPAITAIHLGGPDGLWLDARHLREARSTGQGGQDVVSLEILV